MMLFELVKPMLPSWGESAFDDKGFIFEPKWDGWRIQLHKQGERIEAYARSGRRVTDHFPELKEAASAIRGHSVILDCEGIVLREGKPVFDDFTYRLQISQSGKIRQAVRSHPATFVAFDILHEEAPTTTIPLDERKISLAERIRTNASLMPTLFADGLGRGLYKLMEDQGMEGIVAKRKRSLYEAGITSSDWIKVKVPRAIDCIVLGCRLEPLELIIGLNFRTVANKAVGVVSTGLTEADQTWFLQQVKHLHKQTEGRTVWLEPQLVCRIQYGDRSDTHQLSRTRFVHFVEGKLPEACYWNYGR